MTKSLIRNFLDKPIQLNQKKQRCQLAQQFSSTFEELIVGNKKPFISISSLLILVLIYSLLFVSQEATADTRFKIGVTLPLSGAYAEYGMAARNGIDLAQKEHPDLFKQIDFIIEDDRYDPKLSIAALNKFVDFDNINLLFVWGNEPALAVAPIAERKSLPTLLVSQHPKAGIGYKYIIRFVNPAEDYSKAIVEYLRQQNIKHIGIIQSEISFFNILIDELKKNLAEDETVDISESFLPSELDFRNTITKLKGKKIGALGVYLSPPQLLQFLRQTADLHYKPAIFGTTPFESQVVLKNAVANLNGAVYSQLNVKEEFVARYKKEYGDDTQISYAANAYLFATLSGKLFGSLEKELPAESIISEFKKTKEEDGPAGKYRYKETDSAGMFFEFPIAVKQFEGDKIVTISQTD